MYTFRCSYITAEIYGRGFLFCRVTVYVQRRSAHARNFGYEKGVCKRERERESGLSTEIRFLGNFYVVRGRIMGCRCTPLVHGEYLFGRFCYVDACYG